MLNLYVQSFSRSLPLIFDIFTEDDEAQSIGAERKSEKDDRHDLDEDFRWALKKDTTTRLILTARGVPK